jgi:hypothetical protein
MLETQSKRYIKGKPGEGMREVGPRLDNPVTSDAPFWDNLPFMPIRPEEKVSDLNRKILDFANLPLFKLVFACPVIALFVDPTSKRPGSEDGEATLLELMQRSWLPPDGVKEGPEKALEVVCSFPSGTARFDNLWAPLHSLMVPNKRPVPHTIKVEAKDDNAGGEAAPRSKPLRKLGRPAKNSKPETAAEPVEAEAPDGGSSPSDEKPS